MANIFSRLFSSFKKETQTSPTKEILKLNEFEVYLHALLDCDKYLAKSDYLHLVDEYADIFATFNNLQETRMLEHYCTTNNCDIERVKSFIRYYQELKEDKNSSPIYKHNEKFISDHLVSEKSYLDGILSEVDPNIKLDDEQRKVVLSDEDYTLVIAGAGAGKTTTVSAKVKYLVERKGIRPDQILVISFTNKAVGELQDKINKALKIDCPVTTFHKTGYAIRRRQETEERVRIVTEGYMFNVVNDYLKHNILEYPELVDKLILFFGSYFDAPYEGDDLNSFFNYITKADFTTLRGNMDEYTEKVIDQRSGRYVTIAHERLRSLQEVVIANFLYMNNIEYTYEKTYPYNILRSHKPYTPDFTITQGEKIAYIEHFGITEDGRNNRYTQEQLNIYKKEVNDKILLHRQHDTDLIYTFSAYNDGRDLLVHLQEELIAHGFELKRRPSKEVFEKIVSTEENKYISRLVKFVCTFIQNFKTNDFVIDDFARFRTSSSNERTKLFLTICEQCYLEYSKRLKEYHAIDFEDMINDSARILREEEVQGKKLDFKYIIVDEYQDISRQRFNLTKELCKLCNAKVIAVGDDWQSIYAYAGSDITLFTDFKNTFGYGLELCITKTYRNAQEVIDIAGGFVQKNLSQIRKALISPKHIEHPIVIKTYTEEVDRKEYEGKGGKYFLIGKCVEEIMDGLISKYEHPKILLLGRYGFDGYNLTKSADFIYDDKTGSVRSKKYNADYFDFMTVHRAKGLGYDHVIIINARNETYGFPSQVQEDPVLKYVVKDDHSYDYAEERRLFYVALTRTKNRVYIITPQQHPSEFVLELIRDYPQVKVFGKIDKEPQEKTQDKRCPVCGYPLQLRYKKAYGLKLWICTNEPEICDFMTNNLAGDEMTIMKCDKCKDGYLIVKDGRGSGPFLGCTNYKADKTGCNNYVTKDLYLRKYKGQK
ncbi:MAG: UvrD-helicase domain-containing protein [Bacteroidaceae bacterium]|nr:UvrD-helicase domain-containing protein [Paraprevotella sp.]MDY3287585.1 UvrD-helicase domain-containing protein [Bacteroidaceae bacterium]